MTRCLPRMHCLSSPSALGSCLTCYHPGRTAGQSQVRPQGIVPRLVSRSRVPHVCEQEPMMAAQRGPGFQGPACSSASGWDESRSRGPRKSCVVAGEARAVPCCLPELHQCVVCRVWGLDSGSSSSCPDLPVLTGRDRPLRAGRPG